MRFSLQTLLILITGLGAWCALLARLFVQQPVTFYSVWYFSTNIVPFALAIMAMVVLSRESQYAHRARMWAVGLGTIPIAGLAALPLLRHFELAPPVRATIAQPHELARLDTRELLEEYLPLHMEHAWGWQELADRVLADQIEPAEVEAAVDQLITYMRENQEGGQRRLRWATSVVSAARRQHLISEEQLIEFHHAFYGPGELQCSRVRASDLGVDFAINKGRAWTRDVGLGWKLLWHVDSVSIDGRPINYRDDAALVPITRMTGFDAGDGIIGSYTGRLEPGQHRLEAKLVCAYASLGDTIGIATRSHPADWPDTIVTWEEQLGRTFQVYAQDEPLFALSQDPALDPTEFIGASLTVAVRKNRRQLRLRFRVDEQRCPIGLYFDAKVVSGDTEVHVGQVYFVKSGETSEIRGATVTLDPLVELGETAELVLTPNPSPVLPFYRRSDPVAAMRTIWGQPIVIGNLPVLVQRT